MLRSECGTSLLVSALTIQHLATHVACRLLTLTWLTVARMEALATRLLVVGAAERMLERWEPRHSGRDTGGGPGRDGTQKEAIPAGARPAKSARNVTKQCNNPGCVPALALSVFHGLPLAYFCRSLLFLICTMR